MRMSPNMSFEFDGVEKRLGKESMNLGKLAMANQMMTDMNRFVPMDMGSLRQAVSVVDGGDAIEWRMPYAGPIYHGMPGGFPAGNWTTPGTGPRWDDAARRVHINDWRRAFIGGSNL